MVTRTKADLGALFVGELLLCGDLSTEPVAGEETHLPAGRLFPTPTVLGLPRRHFSFFLFSFKKTFTGWEW